MTATLEPVTRSSPGGGRSRPTPRRYRRASLALCALLLLLLVVAERSATNGADSTQQLARNTGPVLIAVHGVVAHLGEADAAATAAVLAGQPEDIDQRTHYVDAMAQVETQLEQVSALIGDDAEAHDLLQDIQTKVSRYAGLVEATRVETANNFPGTQGTLADAAALRDDINVDSARLTTLSEQRFTNEAQQRSSGFPLTILLFVVVVAALVYAQVGVARRSHRVFNIPLVLATLLVIGTCAWAVVIDQRARADLVAAQHEAYDSIAAAAAIQAQSFSAKSAETLALVTGDAGARQSADAAMKRLLDRAPDAAADTALATQARSAATLPDSGLLAEAVNAADSSTERAATAEMLLRWGGYRANVEALRRSDKEAARTIARGALNTSFGAFDDSVRGVLAQNETQYRDALQRASDRYAFATVVMVVGLLAAMLLVVAGYRLRIREYL